MHKNFRSKKSFNLLNIPLLLYLTIFEINFLNKRLDAKPNSPATPQDIFLYKQMGASYLCKSINDKIDFDFKKAFAVATYTFAEVIFSKHGNLIKEAGKEKLTTERVLYIGEIEILNSAIKICPKQVPSKIKKNFENTLNKIKKQKNKKK
tara:strand:- start:3834 stop:4283 length:450 start_codon:yes stop_codon:yes gene_type:complete